MGYDTTLEEIKMFIKKYKKINGITPKLSEWKVKDGFPCNKEKLLKLCGKYNDLLESMGEETFSYGKRRYNKEKLLSDLKNAVLQHRSVDFTIIRKDNNLKHRDIYTNVFGSVKKSLRLCGITNNEIYLMKKYKNYNLENPIDFIIKNLYNGKLTLIQESLIAEFKDIVCNDVPTRSNLQYKISLSKIYRNFNGYTEFVILCGAECALSNKQEYMANDGHICDSYEECIIDNELNKRNIKHEVHIKYPNSSFITDFAIGNIFVEYTGYKKAGRDKYIKKLELKRKIAKENNILLIEIDNVSDYAIKDMMQRLLVEILIE